jgi:membrane associated rhomboid family serine protease
MSISETRPIDAARNIAGRVISIASWVFWFGIFPIASEACGKCRPHVIRGIAVVTVLTSCWFWFLEWSDSPKMQSLKNLKLWSGDTPPDPATLVRRYTKTSCGDGQAFVARLERLVDEVKSSDQAVPTFEALVLAAHNSLSPGQRCIGQFRCWQVITSAFLHKNPLHLICNLVILLMFGGRVNALLGSVKTIVVYPVLAIAGSAATLLSHMGKPLSSSLGASDAIMGLVGMYLILFPIQPVHVAAWIRAVPLFHFRLYVNIDTVRGFGVVLFFIGCDCTRMALGEKDGIGHWAHLGGFAAGVFLAILLLVTRRVDAGGGDLLSLIRGRRASALTQ